MTHYTVLKYPADGIFDAAYNLPNTLFCLLGERNLKMKLVGKGKIYKMKKKKSILI